MTKINKIRKIKVLFYENNTFSRKVNYSIKLTWFFDSCIINYYCLFSTSDSFVDSGKPTGFPNLISYIPNQYSGIVHFFFIEILQNFLSWLNMQSQSFLKLIAWNVNYTYLYCISLSEIWQGKYTKELMMLPVTVINWISHFSHILFIFINMLLEDISVFDI